MRIPTLIMAGGKGKRIRGTVEKPLLPVLDKSLIERTIKAVKDSGRISSFYIVTSKNTHNTEEWCLMGGFNVIRTDGKGYHSDLKQAILETRLDGPVLVVSYDLPALTGSYLDTVVSTYESANKDALRVLVPLRSRVELGLSSSSKSEHQGKMYVVSGINILNGAKILEKKLDEHTMVTESLEASLNVNTPKDLEIAEKLLKGTK